MLALSLSPDLPEGPVTGAANSLVQSGILGSLVLLFGVALVVVVLKWNKTNELRVKDQKETVEAIRRREEAYTQLVTGVMGAMRDLVGTTDALKEAMKANTEASRAMERTINETVREAIRAGGYRRFTPPSGSAPVAPVPKRGP